MQTVETRFVKITLRKKKHKKGNNRILIKIINDELCAMRYMIW